MRTAPSELREPSERPRSLLRGCEVEIHGASSVGVYIARRTRGFTLVEVLATMTLLGIVLPVLMSAISTAIAGGEIARQRTDAAALADSQLSRIVATGDWQNGAALAGDYSPDPNSPVSYHWQATVQNWPQGTALEQIDMQVTWQARDGQRQITVSTLAYNGSNSTGTSSSGTSSSGTSSGSKSSGTGSKSGSGSSGGTAK